MYGWFVPMQKMKFNNIGSSSFNHSVHLLILQYDNDCRRGFLGRGHGAIPLNVLIPSNRHFRMNGSTTNGMFTSKHL